MTNCFSDANVELMNGTDGFFFDSSSSLQSKGVLLPEDLDGPTNSLQKLLGDDDDSTKVTNENDVHLNDSIMNTDSEVTVVIPEDDGSFESCRLINEVDAIGCNSNSNASTLDQDQLQNIADFLQRQPHSPSNNKGIVYYAPTNTRIVYQVLYPDTTLMSGGDDNDQRRKTGKTTNGSGRGGGSSIKTRKMWGRKLEENEQKIDSPILSQEEKLAKKKQRPRTRSGRVSKPPSYMVKDYKRIHHLDYDEEPYDDSDGGYSDFQFSAEESNDVTGEQISDPTPSEMCSKARNYKCLGCKKAYIGRAGLSRHLKLNPEHGQMEHVETGSNVGSVLVSSLGETTKSVSSFSKEDAEEKPQMQHLEKANAGRRRARLKTLLKHCRDEEIMELVMPRLVRRLNTWQFLLKKCEVGSSARHDLDRIQKELGNVVKEAEEMAQNCLVTKSAATNRSSEGFGNSCFNVTDCRAARAMGIANGMYEVKNSFYSEDRDRPAGGLEEEEPTASIIDANECLNENGGVLDVDGGNSGSGWSLGDSGILDMLNHHDSLSLDSNQTLLLS